jgi:hypothetical protein
MENYTVTGKDIFCIPCGPLFKEVVRSSFLVVPVVLNYFSHSQGSIGSRKWFIVAIVCLAIKFSNRYYTSFLEDAELQYVFRAFIEGLQRCRQRRIKVRTSSVS